jgi:hypothetical protein
MYIYVCIDFDSFLYYSQYCLVFLIMLAFDYGALLCDNNNVITGGVTYRPPQSYDSEGFLL